MAFDPRATEDRHVFNLAGYHDNSGGARPKDFKQQENIQKRCSSAANARIKAQEVADRLRQKYCQDDIKDGDNQSNGSGEKVSRLDFAFGIPTLYSPLKQSRNLRHDASLSAAQTKPSTSKHKPCKLKCHPQRAISTENGINRSIQKEASGSPSISGSGLDISGAVLTSNSLGAVGTNSSNSKLSARQNESRHIKLDRLRSKYDKWKKRDCTSPGTYYSRLQKVDGLETVSESLKYPAMESSCLGDSISDESANPFTSNVSMRLSTNSDYGTIRDDSACASNLGMCLSNHSSLDSSKNPMDTRTEAVSNHSTGNITTWTPTELQRDLMEFPSSQDSGDSSKNPRTYTLFPVDGLKDFKLFPSDETCDLSPIKSGPMDIGLTPFSCERTDKPAVTVVNDSDRFRQEVDSKYFKLFPSEETYQNQRELVCSDRTPFSQELDRIISGNVGSIGDNYRTKDYTNSRMGLKTSDLENSRISNTIDLENSRMANTIDLENSRISNRTGLENSRLVGDSAARFCDSESSIFSSEKCSGKSLLVHVGNSSTNSEHSGNGSDKSFMVENSRTNSDENLISFDFDRMASGRHFTNSKLTAKNASNSARFSHTRDLENVNKSNLSRFYDSKLSNSEQSPVIPSSGNRISEAITSLTNNNREFDGNITDGNEKSLIRNVHEKNSYFQLPEPQMVCDRCGQKCHGTCSASNRVETPNCGRGRTVPYNDSTEDHPCEKNNKFVNNGLKLLLPNLFPEQKTEETCDKVSETSTEKYEDGCGKVYETSSENYWFGNSELKSDKRDLSGNVLLTDDSSSAALELSVLSLTSSTSDACLGDQSSITETSDSPVDPKMTRFEVLEPINAASALSTSSKVCHCLTPKVLNTSSCFSGCCCCHEWCMTCGLPMTLCSQCASTRQHHLPNRISQKKKSSDSLSQWKHSSSDSEPSQERGQSSSTTSQGGGSLPTILKPKRKRLSSSKDHYLATVFPEIELRLCSAETKLDSLLASLQDIPGLIGDPDSQLFTDYLSLSIPPEYSWETRDDLSSALDDLSCEIEGQDLVSDSSTLHYPLSDTDCDDLPGSSFVEELSEESGDADDEFECDCEHCLRFPSDAGERTLASLSNEVSLNYGSADGEDLTDLDLDLNIDHLDSLDIILRNSNSRNEVLEVMFESVILRMLLMRPDLLSEQAPPPASDLAITSLPKVAVNQLHIDEELSCSICLGRCELGDQLSSLPCHHLFHPLCVGAWLVKSGTCPVCRHSL